MLSRLLAPGTVRVTLLGLGLAVAGIGLNLKLALPLADITLGRSGRFLLFWGLTGVATVALLAVLVGVTFATLVLE
jgi:hypothetical protein